MPKDHTSAINKSRLGAKPTDSDIDELRSKIIIDDMTPESTESTESTTPTEQNESIITTEEEIITSDISSPATDKDATKPTKSTEASEPHQSPDDESSSSDKETANSIESSKNNTETPKTPNDDNNVDENTDQSDTPPTDLSVNEEPIIIPEEDSATSPASSTEDSNPAEVDQSTDATPPQDNQPTQETDSSSTKDTPSTDMPILQPTEVSNSSTHPISAKPKKNKALIVLLVIFILAVIGGITTWLILRSTPTAQVTDAMTGLLTAKQVSATGSINIKYDEAANPDIRSVKLDLGLASNHIPASTTATLSITTNNNTTFKVDIGETIDVDGTLYLKISGLQKAIESEKIPPEVQNYLDYFADVIKKTDNQWWMITIPDLISQLEDTLQTEIGTAYQDAYQCIIAKVASDDGSEIANLYKKYPFIDVENYTGTNLQPVDGGTIFSISVNRPQLDSFQSELSSTKYQKDLQNCISKLDFQSDDGEEVFDIPENTEETFDTISELPPAYVEVAGFEHRLARFYYDYNIKDYGTINIDLRFSFPSEVSVDIPTSSRSITELINMVVDDTTYMMYDIYSGQSPFSIEVDCTSSDGVDNCTIN